jgi:hypothetical protein
MAKAFVRPADGEAEKGVKTEKPPAEKTTAYWLLLPFRLLWKIFIVVLFLCYLFIGMASTIDLYTRNLYRAQDIDALYTVIDDAVQREDLKNVTVWLRTRPLAETDRLVEMITPKSAPLEPGTFFEIAQRQLKLGRPEEALFWLQLSRYRLRYDTVRCGAEPERIKAFDKIFNLMQFPATNALLQAHPEKLKESMQRVLDFDAKYPVHDNPAAVCKSLSVELPVDEFNWEGYHKLIRRQTEDFIKGMDKAKAN